MGASRIIVTVKNSAQAWRRLWKLTIISGLIAKRLWIQLAARQQMVDQQIRTWEVLDPRVLDALSAVPREAFVPDSYRELAFADAPLPIGYGQSMLAPKMQGRILQALGDRSLGQRARDRHRHRLPERLHEPARRR